MKPHLRSIDVRPFIEQGQPMLLLRDPLELSDKAVVLPQALAPLLLLCDGSRTVAELHAGFLVHTGYDISLDTIQRVIEHLDKAMLLQNDRYAQAYQEAVRHYRQAPARPAALAGGSYPADADDLGKFLDSFAQQVQVNQDGTAQREEPNQPVTPTGQISGLVSPHIDYQRGGPVYAQVWSAAAQAVKDADLVVIFGTNHMAGEKLVTLTRQNYATPFGTLPTAIDVVDAIAAAIGEEEVFDEEIYHQGEHSIELAAVWLHHVRQGQACEMVPILCGSFFPFIEQKTNPADHPTLNAALEALRKATAGRKTVFVAAADLAHIGPAFNDPFAIDYVRYLNLQVADESLIETITRNDAGAFYQTIADENNRRNICGLSPIYMTMRMLNGDVRGRLTGYDRCPADGQNTSFVSICGVVFHG